MPFMDQTSKKSSFAYTALLVGSGILFWIFGDRQNYNGYFVLIGWILIISAYIYYKRPNFFRELYPVMAKVFVKVFCWSLVIFLFLWTVDFNLEEGSRVVGIVLIIYWISQYFEQRFDRLEKK